MFKLEPNTLKNDCKVLDGRLLHPIIIIGCFNVCEGSFIPSRPHKRDGCDVSLF